MTLLNMVQGMGTWRAVVSTEMSFQVHRTQGFTPQYEEQVSSQDWLFTKELVFSGLVS